jgi:cell wall assembly regulator SMI1
MASDFYSVREIWDLLEGWLRENTPWINDSLHPPATESELQAFESLIGTRLPEDFRESFLIHNGQKLGRSSLEDKMCNFFYEQYHYGIDWIVRNWETCRKIILPGVIGIERCEVVGPIKPVMRCEKLIEITSGSTHTYYLDLDPAPGGTFGQVVLYIHEEVKAVHRAASFRDWLLKLAVQYQLGVYTYDHADGIVTINEAMNNMEYHGIKTPEDQQRYDMYRERYELHLGRLGKSPG